MLVGPPEVAAVPPAERIPMPPIRFDDLQALAARPAGPAARHWEAVIIPQIN